MAVLRKQPLRTCVACKTGADKRALIRFVRVDGDACVSAPGGGSTSAFNVAPGGGSTSAFSVAPGGTPGGTPKTAPHVHLDRTGRKAGRGAYICGRKECFERACKTRALERALRCSITPDNYEQLVTEFIDWCFAEYSKPGTVKNA